VQIPDAPIGSRDASGARPPGEVPEAAAAQRQTSALADLWSLLHEGRFRALFVAHFVSCLGDWLAFLALFGLTAFRWHAGVLGVSLLSIAYVLPAALVAPLAGVFVDRWDLRCTLVASDVLLCGIVLLMAASRGLPAMCGLLFLHQTVSCFFNPAQAAALPRLVDRPQLLAANALTTQAAHLTKLVGPAIAGMLVAALGPRSCFFADAASFGLSAALLATLPRLRGAARRPGGVRAVWTELRAGLGFLRRSPRIRLVLGMVAPAMMATGGFIAVISVYARDQLGAGSRSMGLLVSTIGLGTIAGAFVVVHTGKRWSKARSILVGMLVMGAALWILSSARGAPPAFAGAFVLGAAAAAILVPAQALVQEQTPQELVGRVQSSAVAAMGISQMGAMAIAGPAARWLGLPRFFGALALLLLASALASAASAARLRRHAPPNPRPAS